MPSADITEGDSDTQANETTALLASSAEQPAARETDNESDTPDCDSSKDEDVPLPRDQILYLCFARFVEPVAFFCIFPFINQMIWETGEVAETDVGFYSGMIESLFSLTQMVLMIPWGKAADRIGRKPVLVGSLAGVAVATAIFGLSKTLWQMIVFRCFAGLFAGTIVTIRTMISENSTPKTQARAFSFFAFTGNLGIFLGPLIGGALARPATEYPSVFGKFKFFQEYPYALPTFVTGAIGAIATATSALGIKETLVKHDKTTESDAPKKMSTLEIVQSPNVAMTLFLYGYIMVLAFSYTAIMPVFYFTPVHLGGFGFSPLLISLFMGLGGLSQSLWLLVAFPWFQERFGTKWVIILCAITYPFFFALYPLFNVLLRYDLKALFWAFGPITTALGCGVSMSFTAIILILNEVSPAPEVLGTLNALALTLVSGLRAFSPGVFASLFASSVRSGVLGGHLIWILMVILAAGFTVVSQWVPEPNKPQTEGANGHVQSDGAEETNED